MISPLKCLQIVAEASKQRVDLFGAQYRTFAAFTVLNYPIGFIILYYFEAQENESFWFRLLACLICIPLLFYPKWPKKAKFYLPLYWHIVLLYCIPFMAVIMLLRNSFSTEWMLNFLLGIFFFILLVDWLTFLILISISLVLGIVVFLLGGGSLFSIISADFYPPASFVIYLYFYAVLIGALFARNREKINEVKLQALRPLAFSIAHEMRTPLAAIAAGASNLGKFLPLYDKAYTEGVEAKLFEPKMSLQQRERIKDIPAVMEKVSYNAQNIIDMLLMKVRDTHTLELTKCSVLACIKTALEQYPLNDAERKSIHYHNVEDFIFLGKEEMFLHIFFNLLKNSLHQISTVKDGSIDIWTDSKETFNRLHFKDNGQGISKKILSQIFDRFVSGTEFGTGMGLAYCKMAMNSFNGEIGCQSTEGEGAEFILSFPKVHHSQEYSVTVKDFSKMHHNFL